MRAFVLTLLGGAAAAAALVGARARWKARPVERVAPGVASVRVPEHFQPWHPRSSWLGTTLRFTRDDPYFWHMGSNTPYRASLGVTQIAPAQMARLGDGVLPKVSWALEHTEDVAWGEWEPRGTWRLRLGEGRYTPNLMNEPSWTAQAIDPARALVVSYRVWKSSESRDAVIRLVETILASYAPAGDVEAYFRALPRDFTGGFRLALPVELWDPFPWQFDPSGVQWLYFRLDRDWAEDRELPEQAIGVVTFFRGGDAAQAAVAAGILAREIAADLDGAPPAPDPAGAAPVVHEAAHLVRGRREPAWVATGLDAARGVGVAYRPWRRDVSRDRAAEVVARALASYEFTGTPDAFDPPPARAAE